MYYEFSTIAEGFAEYLGADDDPAIDLIQEAWWYGTPLAIPFPRWTFSVDVPPVLDVYSTGMIIELFSSRLVSLLTSSGIQSEAYPIYLVDNKTSRSLSQDYFAYRLLERDDALNKEKSIYITEKFGKKEIQSLQKIVLNDEFLHSKKPMTRVKEKENLIIIHEDIKLLIENENIKGCKFTPVDLVNYSLLKS